MSPSKKTLPVSIVADQRLASMFRCANVAVVKNINKKSKKIFLINDCFNEISLNVIKIIMSETINEIILLSLYSV